MRPDRSNGRGRILGPSSLCAQPRGLWRSAGSVLALTVFLAPLVLLVSGSLHLPGLPPPPTPELIPEPLSWSGYSAAVAIGGLLRAGLNSLIVATIAVPASVLVASLAGFSLTRLSRRTASIVILASVMALTVPATALLVPRFALFRLLGLTNTLAPLIAPALIGASPLYVLVYYLAFRAVPGDLFDVCQIEDLTPIQTWWRVAMPLVRPVTAAVAAMSFVLTWSNFLDPLIYLYERDRYTLPLALRSLATLDPSNFPVFLAGAVLATIPVLLVFAAVQRQFGMLGRGFGRPPDPRERGRGS